MSGRRSLRAAALLGTAATIALLAALLYSFLGFGRVERAVAGIVTDAKTGLPVAGATLRAGARQAVSDDQGRFSLTNVAVGDPVEASKPGYQPFRQPVGATDDLPIALVPRTVTGAVVDAADGRPIPEAVVTLGGLRAATNAGGEFTIDYAPAEGTLFAEANGYHRQSLALSGIFEVDLRLQPRVLNLEVVSAADGQPLAGAHVRAGDLVGETDQFGRLRLVRIPMQQDVRVDARGYGGTTVSYQGQEEARISLDPNTVSGTATDAKSGKPLAGVIITDGRNKTVTDPAGRYELSGVDRGDQVVASADGYEQTEAVVTDANTVDVALKPLPRPAGKAADQLPPGAIREVFLAKAAFPVALAFAPDGRLFYNELRTGRIRIVENGQLRPEPFYDFAVAGQPETGLLGIALDPAFAENHYVYVFYTEAKDRKHDGDTNGPNKVVRLTEVNGVGTDLRELLTLPSGYIHNAGNLHFGPDGRLYVSLGNTDNDRWSQDLASPAGKVLRLNPDGTAPADNPFAGDPSRYAGVFAYGLRNSFDFAFHPVTGEMFATENGPGDNDEINLIRAGQNYGWPASGPQRKPGLIDPILPFKQVVAPTGIEFYRGEQIGAWRNDLFYCSYHGGDLRQVVLAPPDYDRVLAEHAVATNCRLDVVTGPDGALYFSDVDAIYRIRAATAPALPAPAAQPTPTPTAKPTATPRLRTQPGPTSTPTPAP